jgi:hypothetical protein
LCVVEFTTLLCISSVLKEVHLERERAAILFLDASIFTVGAAADVVQTPLTVDRDHVQTTV